MSKKKPKKWKEVERLVAEAFKSPDVTVQKNVLLKALRRKGSVGGYREIDILVTGKLAGQLVTFAIECKDYTKKIGSPEIDSFIGKLHDVGLPTQTSIFVSTSGFSKPAIGRADEVGMKTLILDKRNNEKTKEAIITAIQAKVFLLCSIHQISIISKIEDPYNNVKFYNSKKQYVGALPDFLWQTWLKGDVPLTCGEHIIEVQIPEEFLYLEDGEKSSINKIVTIFKVSALVYMSKSKAISFGLINALSGIEEKKTINFHFSDKDSTQVPIHIKNEELLKKTTSDADVSITFSRIQLPKIEMNYGLLWPPSDKMFEYLKEIHENSEIKQEHIINSPNSFWEFNESYKNNLKRIIALRNTGKTS